MGIGLQSIKNFYHKRQPAGGHRVQHVAVVALGALILGSPVFAQGAGKKANWQDVEADNGAVYKIDLNSISHYNNGTADALVYAVEGPGFNPENMHSLWFDCRGHFRDQTGPHFGPTTYAPPRSMAGRLSEIACAGARDTRLEEASRPLPKDTPANYCVGFSPEACARITAAAEAKPKPRYCKPGSALVGSGLSSEQLRTCYVIGNEESRLKNIRTNRPDEHAAANNPKITLSASRSHFPYIVGLTDYPDGTRLIISVTNPAFPKARELLAKSLPVCENCNEATGPRGEEMGVHVVVKLGSFTAGPFSWAGKPFWQGIFEVEIFLDLLPGEDATKDEIAARRLERLSKPIFTAPVAVNPQQ